MNHLNVAIKTFDISKNVTVVLMPKDYFYRKFQNERSINN